MKMFRERILKVVTIVFIGSLFLLVGVAPALSNNLTVSILQCPKYARAGQNLKAGFQVKAFYVGPLPVNNVAVDIVLRNDTNCPSPAPYAVYSPHYSNGVLLKGGREFVNVMPVQWRQVTLKGDNTIPTDTPEGDYYLCAVIDAGNKVVEDTVQGVDHERDNCACCPVKIIKLQPIVKPQETKKTVK
jgi:hypothetical protein